MTIAREFKKRPVRMDELERSDNLEEATGFLEDLSKPELIEVIQWMLTKDHEKAV